MIIYDIFGKFYDDIIGAPSPDQHELLKKLIKKYHPKAKTLLELGCGTGSVLKDFALNYAATGLDISPVMLEQAKKKVPSAMFFLQDMSKFSLNQKFDVILCLFDSINHLTTFEQWKGVFSSAEKHLNNGGYFIFDYNTIEKLQRLSKGPAFIKHFEDNYLIMRVVPTEKKNVITNIISIFEHQKGNTYQLWKEDIQEASFPQKRIVSALEKYFVVKKIFTITLKKILEKSEKVYVICKKRKTL